jgi:hypothetical protein
MSLKLHDMGHSRRAVLELFRPRVISEHVRDGTVYSGKPARRQPSINGCAVIASEGRVPRQLAPDPPNVDYSQEEVGLPPVPHAHGHQGQAPESDIPLEPVPYHKPDSADVRVGPTATIRGII